MVNISDLQLDKPAAPPPSPRQGGRGSRLMPAIIIVVVLAAVAAYLWWPRRPPQQTRVGVTTEKVTPRPPQRPSAEPPADIDVPPLDQTDPLVRQLVSALS